MSFLLCHCRRFVADRRGAVLVEYSSLLLLLAIGAIAVLVQIGDVGSPSPSPDKTASSD